jgi:hypothetical protein
MNFHRFGNALKFAAVHASLAAAQREEMRDFDPRGYEPLPPDPQLLKPREDHRSTPYWID